MKFNSLEQRLIKVLSDAASRVFHIKELPDFQLRRPEPDHGDYSSNIALILARQVKVQPFETAKLITQHLSSLEFIDRVEPVPAGFINFYLKPDYLIENLNVAMTDFKALAKADRPIKILFEFGQPNTHKIPHIGHLYSYCYGESSARLLQAVGHQVWRANYQGDIGLHVAKCLWAYQRNQQPDPAGLAEKVQYLQLCYQQGSQIYEEDESTKEEIDDLNRAIYLKDSAIVGDWTKTRQWSLDYYRQFEQELGLVFDRYYLESEVSQAGLDIVRRKIGKVFTEDQGAVIFRGEQYGLHTRVFINKFGNPTYEAKDIGLAMQKKQDFSFDQSIVTTAHEQTEYWRVVAKAIELIDPAYQGKIRHIGYGLVNLTTGKMSSRTGQLVTAFDLVAMVTARIKEHISAKRDYSSGEKEKIARLVALGAIKYSFLKSSPGKNISFDLESSISFDGNSGPYLQYTYARCRSVLSRVSQAPGATSLPTINQEELGLLRCLHRFPSIVKAAAADLAPHTLCSYLFELAQRYNHFYERHQILTDNNASTGFRLALTRGVAEVLKTGLNLLGIEVSERI